jgi:hypothetical protein
LKIYRTIGARNPYALAERIQNTGPIDWSPTDSKANRVLLIQILSQSPHMKEISYETLFDLDPKINSPLYSRFLIKKSVMKDTEQPGPSSVHTEEKPCSRSRR